MMCMMRENMVEAPPRLEEETLQGLRRRGRPRISASGRPASGRPSDSQRKASTQGRYGSNPIK